jgi:ribulose-phosphate 3-epimerase
MQIIPTILEKNFSVAKDKILRVKNLVKWVQVDVIDGYFSNGKTFELELINSIEGVENILWETHLMVKDPIKWIRKSIFINASRIIGQVEMMPNINDFVKKVKDEGLEAGLAIDIETPIIEIPEETNLVLLLSRKAGFESFPFEEKIYKKIVDLNKQRIDRGLTFKIGIDGGVNQMNIKKLEDSGADIAYCGTSVFGGNVEDNLKKLNYVGKN